MWEQRPSAETERIAGAAVIPPRAQGTAELLNGTGESKEGKEGRITDAELKQKITRIAEATLKHLKVGRVKVTLQMMVRSTQFPVALNARILAPKDMRRRMVNARIWEPAVEEMCREWIADFLTGILRKQAAAASSVELSAARERQLVLFPGFESLPTRIRTGANFHQFHEVPVPQFLDYETKYRLRAQRDHQRAEELRRLALAVTPYKETGLTVAQAFERAQAQASTKLRLVQPKVG